MITAPGFIVKSGVVILLPNLIKIANKNNRPHRKYMFNDESIKFISVKCCFFFCLCCFVLTLKKANSIIAII